MHSQRGRWERDETCRDPCPPYVLYPLLCFRAFLFSVRALAQTHSLTSLGLCGWA